MPLRVPVLAAKSHQKNNNTGLRGRKESGSDQVRPAWRNPRGISTRPSGYSRSSQHALTHRDLERFATRSIDHIAPPPRSLSSSSSTTTRYTAIGTEQTLHTLLHTHPTTLTLLYDLRSSYKRAPLCQRQNTTHQIHSTKTQSKPPQIQTIRLVQRCSPSSSPSHPSSLSPSRPSP